ncbi:MAG: ABC transporter substrate binding protein [Gammaproteobacteria bacterium]
MNIRQKAGAFFLLTLLFINSLVFGLEQDKYSTSPQSNKGNKWRIAYYEGGPQNNYYYYLTATIKGLMDLGWIDSVEIPEKTDKDTALVWSWLGNVKSDYIEFVRDGYYTAEWDVDKRKSTSNKIIERLNNKKDIDLIIAMGTWAGIDLANNKHSVPTIVMSTSDPVGSHIIKSIEDSGLQHVHARVDPLRYERQVRIFHDIIGFKKLGVAYENSEYGRSYAAVDLIEKVAKETGFEVVRCFTQSDIADKRVAGDSVIKCFQELAGKVDAIYVTIQGGVNAQSIPQLVKITNENRIPTFSQLGSEEVKYGFLMSISRAGGFKPVGVFLAATIAKIFNGAKPQQLNQLFEEAPNIALNLKTAESIGLYLYADVLAAADEIYRNIELPP